ncbi:3-phosphoshikimate 1-carboxyvinyltransferase [Methanomicrobiaceae archaeon CYW5]|uniref:3-phosphoshikimate 1-carboxyvinyltransferase n=1 Tax=Methanovulcanius yangii TaxID=1789227 RepID=UPI0029C9D5B0|nr:3-phosphoshikimate 1-carboxyvinyltransferase [Methanovulcanius yangii]MBT8508062.1 3-phosphoshikimate 1-carboxyvinyltransferase [Methanovulcanius yangii]
MNIRLPRLENIEQRFTAPPSKSGTHRAFIAASLANGGSSAITRSLRSEDTMCTRTGLAQMGVLMEDVGDDIIVDGAGCTLDSGRGAVTLDCRNSGTTLRLLASVGLLHRHPVTLTGSSRMQERPIGPLAEALRTIGAAVVYENQEGYPPVTVTGRLMGGPVAIDAGISSQFVSSVMMAAPCAEEPVEITLMSPGVSRSYVDLTADVMGRFGADVIHRSDGRMVIHNRGYRACDYRVEGDYSSASYFFAIAAVCGGCVTVSNLNPSSLQGDRRMLDILEEMGCSVHTGAGIVTVERDGPLVGVSLNMAQTPDIIQTVAAVASFAAGPTSIEGTANLRHKESDRVAAVVAISACAGASVDVGDDSLTIHPGTRPGGGMLDPVDDHRTAMSGAVVALGRGDVTIKDAECVSKSFPGFWDALGGAGI